MSSHSKKHPVVKHHLKKKAKVAAVKHHHNKKNVKKRHNKMKSKAKAKGHSKMAGAHGCKAGQTWVKPYTKKNGTKVKGYCRG